jgi:hypothetical protein
LYVLSHKARQKQGFGIGSKKRKSSFGIGSGAKTFFVPQHCAFYNFSGKLQPVIVISAQCMTQNLSKSESVNFIERLD